MIELRKEMSGDRANGSDARREPIGMMKRIEAAVKRGDLSREEAGKKLIEIRQKPSDKE